MKRQRRLVVSDMVDAYPDVDPVVDVREVAQTPEHLRPALILAVASPSTRELTLPAGQWRQLLIPSPRRLAFFVWLSDAMAEVPTITPGRPSFTPSNAVKLSFEVASYSINDYLGLMSLDWWAYSPSGGTIYIAEATRPAG